MNQSILIVDDEPEILTTIKRTLEFSLGLTIYTASGVKEGLTICREKTPAVVLTDICMADGTGVDLLQELKPHNPSTQVIIMTGQSTLDRVIDCLEKGASDYLMKPIDMPLMEKIVKESIERYNRWYQIVKVNLHKKRESKAA